MAKKLVNARWVAPFEAQLSDGTVLIPNETVVPVPADEAKDSDYWEATGGKPPKDSESDS